MSHNHWRPREDAALLAAMEQRLPWPDIALHVGRSANACTIRAKRGLKVSRKQGALSAAAVGLLLGMDGKKVHRLIRDAGLPALPSGLMAGKYRMVMIDLDALTEWLASEESWQWWDPARITEPGLAEWAGQLRAGKRFLTVGAVGERLHIGEHALNARILNGRQRAVRCWRGNWLAREDWVVEPTQRSLRGVPSPPPMTAYERCIARAHRGVLPLRAIAMMLGRSTSGVWRCGTARVA